MSTKQHGAVIKFKVGTSQEDIARALNSIKHLLDLPTTTTEYSSGNGYTPPTIRPFRWSDLVQSFNPEHGSPVFYVP